MDTTFSECVVALKDLRRTVHSDTDPSIGMALEAVINKLEGYKDKANIDEAEVKVTIGEGLMIISTFLNLLRGPGGLDEALLTARYDRLPFTKFMGMTPQWISVKQYDCVEPKKVGHSLN